MKGFFVFISCFGVVVMGVPGQTTPATNTDFQVSERGAHHRVWKRYEQEPAPGGKTRLVARQVIELATGLCHINTEGVYEDSDPSFEVSADGLVVADRCQHKLRVAPRVGAASNLADGGELECVMPNGNRLRLRLAAVNLYSKLTGRSLQIGAVRDVEGELTAPNEITYFGAIEGMLAGNVRIRNEIHQWSHDVVFTENFSDEQLRKLASLGLKAEDFEIEVWHQVLGSPPVSTQPSRSPGVPAQDAGNEIGFQSMGLSEGKSFIEGDQDTGSVRISKDWVQYEGATYLVERAKYKEVRALMKKLPASRMTASNWKASTTRLALLDRGGTNRGGKGPGRNRSLLAGTQTTGPEFVWDYTVINTTQTNLTCAGNTTYYVSAKVIVTGTLTLEGNTVLKLAASPTAGFAASNIICATGPYRPVVVTSVDRNGLGEDIGSGTPSGYYGGTALDLSGSSGAVLSRVHFSYLSNAVAGTGITLRDCQVLNCKNGFAPATANPTLQNVLIYKVHTFAGSPSWPEDVTGENVTAHFCTNLVANTSGTMRLTNSLLVCVTNWQCAQTFTNSTVALNSDAGVFQTVGAGLHYLADQSPYRNVGTTNISRLSERGRYTTSPPAAYVNTTIATNANFIPRAQRDRDIPDLGFGYDPLDYAFGGVTANANVTFEAGTVVGWFRTSSGWYHAGHGITMGDGKVIRFDGTKAAPTGWVRCSTVQEGINGQWQGGYGPGGITGWAATPEASPKLQAQFTLFTAMANDSQFFRDDWGYLATSVNHCEFWNGSSGGYVSSLFATNCLFHRGSVWTEWNGEGAINSSWVLRNCLLFGGVIQLNRWLYTDPPQYGSWIVRDTAFDGTSVGFNDDAAGDQTWTDFRHNAFNAQMDPANFASSSDVVVSNYNWQVGPSGQFYLPSDSALLDAGSANADGLGLYHFTTLADQYKEGAGTVDISYHYVAVDGNGNPTDYDADGSPDSVEDTNGNGTVESGESDWMSGSDPGLRVRISRPRTSAVVP